MVTATTLRWDSSPASGLQTRQVGDVDVPQAWACPRAGQHLSLYFARFSNHHARCQPHQGKAGRDAWRPITHDSSWVEELSGVGGAGFSRYGFAGASWFARDGLLGVVQLQG